MITLIVSGTSPSLVYGHIILSATTHRKANEYTGYAGLLGESLERSGVALYKKTSVIPRLACLEYLILHRTFYKLTTNDSITMTSLRENPGALTHKDTYPGISTSRPELSQAGKTVLVTGGGVGVGYAIANSFAQAKASTLVLTGRREHVLQAAAEKLKADSASINPGLKVHIKTADVTNSESVASLWGWLAEKGIVIDVLILNAGRQSPFKTILELGLEEVWEFYKVNVYGHMDFTEHFYKQDRRGSPTRPVRNYKSSRYMFQSVC